MIDQERVRVLTKLAALEKHDGKKYKKAVKCFRYDYVVRQLLAGLISGTLAFAGIFFLWLVCHLDQALIQINQIQIEEAVFSLLGRYFVFMAVYLLFIDFYANRHYADGQSSLRRYDRRLKRLSEMYEEEK